MRSPPDREPGPEGDGARRHAAGAERVSADDPDLDSPELERERARRVRRFSALAQAGGLVFLAVVSLGLLPSLLSAYYPAAGERAAVLVWVLAPAVSIALLAVAALRFPR